MKTLITGGGGLVGSAMKSELKLTREFCDLTDRKQTEALFKTIKPEGVIHCAGKVGGIGGNSNYKGEYFYDNLMVNTNVIEASRKAGVKRLVAFLSTCVFPDKVTYPLTIDQIHTGVPHTSNDAYSYAKRMADVQINAYREQYGINIHQ
jgi:GDP-L-fucose synthase